MAILSHPDSMSLVGHEDASGSAWGSRSVMPIARAYRQRRGSRAERSVGRTVRACPGERAPPAHTVPLSLLKFSSRHRSRSPRGLSRRCASVRADVRLLRQNNRTRIMNMQTSWRGMTARLAKPGKVGSGLVRRLVQAQDDPAKCRIRGWLSDLDDAQLLSLGLTSEDIALLRDTQPAGSSRREPRPSKQLTAPGR